MNLLSKRDLSNLFFYWPRLPSQFLDWIHVDNAWPGAFERERRERERKRLLSGYFWMDGKRMGCLICLMDDWTSEQAKECSIQCRSIDGEMAIDRSQLELKGQCDWWTRPPDMSIPGFVFTPLIHVRRTCIWSRTYHGNKRRTCLSLRSPVASRLKYLTGVRFEWFYRENMALLM